jgi:hypothetical protein
MTSVPNKQIQATQYCHNKANLNNIKNFKQKDKLSNTLCCHAVPKRSINTT